MTNDEREKLVQDMARSDATFDGRPFDGLGRADKERYLSRSGAALAIAEAAFAKQIEAAYKEGWRTNYLGGQEDHTCDYDWHASNARAAILASIPEKKL